MQLYLVRHAEAVERGPAVAEEQRWLTAAGRLAFRENARLLARKGARPDLILTSPLVRAVQTGEILAEALQYDGEVAVAVEAAPGFDRQRLARLLERYPAVRRLVVVGHEPDLGSLTAALLGLEATVPLKKGMIVALKLDAGASGPASCRWVIHKGEKLDRLAER